MQIKDYLLSENTRNRNNHKLYEAILREAFGKEDSVLVAHHLTFDGSSEPDEIPSADTMIFDHDIAQRIWPNTYKENLAELATLPCDERDARLEELFYNRHVAGAYA